MIVMQRLCCYFKLHGAFAIVSWSITHSLTLGPVSTYLQNPAFNKSCFVLTLQHSTHYLFLNILLLCLSIR